MSFLKSRFKPRRLQFSNLLAGPSIPSFHPGRTPNEPADQSHGGPVKPAGGEIGLSEQNEEEPVRVTPPKREAIREKLIKRIVNEGGEVRFGPLSLDMNNAVRCSEEEIEDTELRAAAIPCVILGDCYSPTIFKDQANNSGLVTEDEVLWNLML
jgi:hypothetical protein